MDILFNQLLRNKFPDGMSTLDLSEYDYKDGQAVSVIASIRSYEDLVLLAQLKDQLRQLGVTKTRLVLHYVLGSRMDRDGMIADNTTKVVCDLVNSMGFDSIAVAWGHSSSVIDRLNANISSYAEFLFIVLGLNKILASLDLFTKSKFSLILPDSGVAKRYWNYYNYRVAHMFPNIQVVECGKRRDVQSGRLTDFVVPDCEVAGPAIIIDDLCDGGGTFCGLASKLREKGFDKVGLAVYHGIFSKGEDLPGIDCVYTSNSFRWIEPVGKVVGCLRVV